MGRAKKDEKEEDVAAAFLKQMEKANAVPPTAVQLGQVLVNVLAELAKVKTQLEEARQEVNLAKESAENASKEAEEMEERLKALEEEVKGSNKNHQDLEKKMQKNEEETNRRTVVLEKRSIAANIVIRNLELVSPNETKEQSRDLANNILAAVGLEDLEAEDAYRFKKNPKAKNNKPPALLVRLESPKDKKDLFENIAKLRGTKFGKISVQNQYPACMRAQIAEKEKEAYEIRQASKGKTKTRLWETGGKIYVQVKGEGEKFFKFKEEEEKKYP